MDICMLPADLSGAGMLRCIYPGVELAKQFGHDVYTVPPRRVSATEYVYDLKELPHADIYVLHQRKEKFWHKMIPELRARGSIVISDTDDNYRHLPPNHTAWRGVDEQGIRDLHKVYSLSNAITVSTPYLTEQYKELNPNVICLPNYLDREQWADLPDQDFGRLRIGWQGWSNMRPWDLRILQGIIGPFLRRHPEIDFVAAGDPKVHDILGVPEKQRKSFDRRNFLKVQQITNTMDIGLVPLELNPFNEAKSDLKGKEYNASGIPFIASPSSSYLDWCEHGKNGFLAKRPRDWTNYLELLCEDAQLRKRMGTYGRSKVERYWIQDHAFEWDNAYKSLTGDWADQITRTAIARGALQKPPEFSSFIRYLSEQRPLNTVVEIGTAQGGTLGALCAMAEDDALIVSIDLPGGDFGGDGPDVYGQRNIDKMKSYAKKGQRIEFIQGNSQLPATKGKLEQILDGRQIDLLFIDGDHAYEGVKKDFLLYSPLASKVGFHDILPHSSEKRSQVDIFWNEIKDDYDYREFTEHGYEWGWGSWGGIGVIARNGEEPPPS